MVPPMEETAKGKLFFRLVLPFFTFFSSFMYFLPLSRVAPDTAAAAELLFH